ANAETSQSLIWLRQRKPDALAQHRRTAAANLITNLAAGIAPAEVRQNDRLVLETIGVSGDIVEMNVLILRRALLMSAHHERALHHQHLGLEHRPVFFEDAPVRVAGVEKDRSPPLLGHF